MMAEEAARTGDDAKASSYASAAEQLAGRLITLEEEIESLKSLLFQTSEAADQAKAAVSQNALSLQEKLSERQKLLGQLDQARMQEQMNEAMSTLSEAVGEDVPTLAEVRDKIEARYAKAKGAAELVEEGSSEGRMLEIEAAARNQEAKARLTQIREQLGIEAAAPQEIPPVHHQRGLTPNKAGRRVQSGPSSGVGEHDQVVVGAGLGAAVPLSGTGVAAS